MISQTRYKPEQLHLVNFSLWESIDPKTGLIQDPLNPYFNQSIAGRVLVCDQFDSQVQDEAVILELVRNGCAPAGFVSLAPSQHILSGLVIAGIMYGRSISFSLLQDNRNLFDF